MALKPPQIYGHKQPFPLYNYDLFQEAREMFRSNTLGWGLTLAESLGLMQLPVDKPGGCLGCYWNMETLSWMLKTVSLAAYNKKIFYLDSAIRVYLKGNNNTYMIETQPLDGTLKQSGALAVTKALEFLYRFDAETVVAQAVIEWNESRETHACMVTFAKNESIEKKIDITWIDPNSTNLTAFSAAKVIGDNIASEKYHTYKIVLPPCPGPQRLSLPPDPSTLEPEGYCEAWSAIMILYTVALDGAAPQQVLKELESMYPHDTARFLRNFIRVASRNVARFVKEFNPQECPKNPCCKTHNYCTPDGVNVLTGPDDEQIPISETCYPGGFAPKHSLTFLHKSYNDMWWFNDGEADHTVGFKISPAGSDPDFKNTFDAYVSKMSLALPKLTNRYSVVGVNYCMDSSHKKDIGIIVIKGRFVELGKFIASGGKLERGTFPQINQRLKKASEDLRLSFGSFLRFAPMFVYVPPQPSPATEMFFLDIDHADPLQPDQSEDYTALLENFD
jgi:hypothetical protein